MFPFFISFVFCALVAESTPCSSSGFNVSFAQYTIHEAFFEPPFCSILVGDFSFSFELRDAGTGDVVVAGLNDFPFRSSSSALSVVNCTRSEYCASFSLVPVFGKGAQWTQSLCIPPYSKNNSILCGSTVIPLQRDNFAVLTQIYAPSEGRGLLSLLDGQSGKSLWTKYFDDNSTHYRDSVRLFTGYSFPQGLVGGFSDSVVFANSTYGLIDVQNVYGIWANHSVSLIRVIPFDKTSILGPLSDWGRGEVTQPFLISQLSTPPAANFRAVDLFGDFNFDLPLWSAAIAESPQLAMRVGSKFVLLAFQFVDEIQLVDLDLQIVVSSRPRGCGEFSVDEASGLLLQTCSWFWVAVFDLNVGLEKPKYNFTVPSNLNVNNLSSWKINPVANVFYGVYEGRFIAIPFTIKNKA